MPRDRRQQIVKVMRNTACKLANRLHFLTLYKLRFKRLELGRVVQNSNQHILIALTSWLQRHLNKSLHISAPHLQELGLSADTAQNRILQPVLDRAAKAFQNGAKALAHKVIPPEKIARKLV